MSISFSGLASGLDTSSWITSLTALKQAKVTELQEERENILLSKETLNSIKSFFNSFRATIEKITDTKFHFNTMDLFAQNLAVSSNVNILTATATPEAEEATYEVVVDKLATNTSAISNFTYTTTIIETSVAGLNSKLTDLGINIKSEGSNISVKSNGVDCGIVLKRDDTIQTFINKLKDIGVEANYNEASGVFAININADDITDIDNTNIVDALHLQGVNEGYTSNHLQVEEVDTIYSAATTATLMSELGVKNGIITITANDADYNVTIKSTSTMGSFISDLNALNIDAKLDSTGIFTISGAEITNEGTTDILNALGMDIDIYSKTQKTNDLKIQTIITQSTGATSSTKLKDIGEGLTINTNDTVIVKNSNNQYTTITISNSTTIGDLLTKMNNAGLAASIDSDGQVEISGGVITGGSFDAVTALGLTESPYSAMVTGNTLTETIENVNVANSSTRLVEDLGVSVGYLEVTDANGTKHYEKIYSGQTVSQFISDLQDFGVSASIENGVMTFVGGGFKTLSNSEVQTLVSNGSITEANATYKKGSDIITKLFGSSTISSDHIESGSMIAKSDALSYTATETINASGTTKLSSLGIGTGNVTIKGNNGSNTTVTITSTMTVNDFVNKMTTAGINASWDSTEAKITIDGDVTDVGGTNIISALGLQEEVLGTYNSSNALYYKETIIADATGSTKLSEFGITSSQSAADRTVKIYDADGTLKKSITVTNSTTLDSLVSQINSAGISASLDGGILNIQDGYIQNSILESGMGLQYSSQASYALGSIMTTTTTTTATGDSTLASIISNLGTTSAVSSGYTLKFNDKSLAVSSTSTLNDIISLVNQNGGNASLDSTGRLNINGGVLTGTVATALGFTSVTNTSSVSATGKVLSTKEENFADTSTKLSDLGISTKTFDVYNSYGTKLSSYTLGANATVGDFFSKLNEAGIDATISNGVISLTSAEGKYISGSIPTAFGITTQTTTQIISSTSSSTLSVNYTDTITATASSTLGQLNLLSSGTLQAVVKDENGTQIATQNFNKDSSINDIFNFLNQNDIQASITDGVISLYSPSGNTMAGDLATKLGISTQNKSSHTTTIGSTLSSTAKVTYTLTEAATGSTKISDIVTVPNSNAVLNVRQTDADSYTNAYITITQNTTFDELFSTLEDYNINASIKNNVITFKQGSGEGNYVLADYTGSVLSQLGVAMNTTTSTETVGQSLSSTTPITYTVTDRHVANKATTLGELGITNSSNMVLSANTSSGTSTVTFTSSSTLEDVMDWVEQYDMKASLVNGRLSITDNNDSGAYISGTLATALGIGTTSSTTTTTNALSMTSSSPITYQVEVEATESTRLIDVVGSYVNDIRVYDGSSGDIISTIGVVATTTANSDFTIGDLINLINTNSSCTATFTDGRIVIENNGQYLSDASSNEMLHRMGIDTQATTVGATFGASATSTAKITYTTVKTVTSTIAQITSNALTYCGGAAQSVTVVSGYTIDGTMTSSSLSGTVFAINTTQDLLNMQTLSASGEDFLGKTFVLNADVVLNSSFTGITIFKGTFDGNGHTISLHLTNTDQKTGLFKDLYSATVKNLRLTGSVVGRASNSKVGALAADVSGGTIDNVYSSASVVGSGNTAGGLIGQIQSGTISNCAVASNMVGVTSTATSTIGGLVGEISAGTVMHHSKFVGNLVYASGAEYVGGIAGSTNHATITQCYTSVNVSNLSSSSNVKIGGFTGIASGGVEYNGCVDKTSATSSSFQYLVGSVSTTATSTVNLNNSIIYALQPSGCTLSNVISTSAITDSAIQGYMPYYLDNKWSYTSGDKTSLELKDPTLSTGDTSISNKATVTIIGTYTIDGIMTSSALSGSVIEISTAQDMMNLQTLSAAGFDFSGKTFVLTADIDMTGTSGFTGITYFNGKLDGNGHQITYSINTTGARAGLFHTLDAATVWNLDIDATINGTNGSLIAGGVAAIAEHFDLANIHVVGEIDTQGASVGGLVGKSNSSGIYEYCRVNANIAGSQNVGGLIGWVYEEEEEAAGLSLGFCQALVDLTCTGSCAGGFIGRVDGVETNMDISQSEAVVVHVGGDTGTAGNFIGYVGDVTAFNMQACIDNSQGSDYKLFASTYGTEQLEGVMSINNEMGVEAANCTNCWDSNGYLGGTDNPDNIFSSYMNSLEWDSSSSSLNDFTVTSGNKSVVNNSIPTNPISIATRDTTLAQLGMSDYPANPSEYNPDGFSINSTWITLSISCTSTMTVGDLMDAIESESAAMSRSITCTLTSDGKLQLSANTFGLPITITSGNPTLLKLFTDDSSITSTSKVSTTTSTVSTTATSTTKMSQLGLDGTYTMTLDVNGTQQIVTINSSDTIANINTKLGSCGITCTISGGKVTIGNTTTRYVSGMSSELANALKLNTSDLTSVGTSNTTVNTNSNTLSLTVSRTATSSTSLSDLGITTAQSIVLLNKNTNAGYTVSIDSTSNLADINSQLANLTGSTMSMSVAGGKVSINSTGDYYISSMSSALANTLKLQTGEGKSYTTTSSTSYGNGSANLGTITVTETRTASGSTKFSDLVNTITSEQTIGIYSNGVVSTITIAATDTLDDITSKLGAYGINANISSSGIITLGTNNSDNYITSISSILKNTLKLNGNGYKTYTSSQVGMSNSSALSSVTTVKDLTASTTFEQLGLTSASSINVVSNGNTYSVSITPDKTVGEVLSVLDAYGISGYVTDGKLTLIPNTNCYVTSVGSTVSNALKLGTTGGLNGSYTTTVSNSYTNSSSNQMKYVRSDLVLNGDTKLGSISGNTTPAGAIKIHLENGSYATVSVTATQTLDDFFNQIAIYGLNGSVSSDGKVQITGNGNVYLESVTGGSTLLSALKLSGVTSLEQSTSTNRNSNVQKVTQTVAATGTTTLEDLLSGGSGATFDASGNINLVLTTKSNAGYKTTTLTFSKTQNITDVIDTLATNGINAKIDSTGKFSVSGQMSDFDISGTLGTFLMGSYTKDYQTDTTYNTSTVLTQKTSNVMTSDTALSTFGITNGNIVIMDSGYATETLNINTTELLTVGDFQNLLSRYGFTSNVDSQGRLSVTSLDGKYLVNASSGSSNILTKFGINDPQIQGVTQQSSALNQTTVSNKTISMGAKLSDLTDSSGNNLGITSGNIYVYNNGVKNTVYIDANSTLQDIADKLAGFNINMGIDNGKIYVEGVGNSYVTTDGLASSSATNLLSKVGLNGARTETISTSSKALTTTQQVTNAITEDTKLSDIKTSSGASLGITNGTFNIYENGVKHTESITADTTVGDLLATLEMYGFSTNIASNGAITISATGNSYVENNTSNVAGKLFSNQSSVNTYTSDKLEYTTTSTQAISRNTKLSDINEGNITNGYITVIKDGVRTDISINADNTVGTLVDQLALYGFDTVISESGQLTIKANGNSSFQSYSGAGTASNALQVLGVDQSKWITTNTYSGKVEDVITKTTTQVEATRDTLLSDLGVTTGEYYIYNDGVKFTALISSDETLGSLMDTLNSFGIQTSLTPGADGTVLSLIGSGNSYIAKSNSVTNSSNVVGQLFNVAASETSYEYSSDKQTSEIVTTYVNATEDTLLSYFDTPWGGTTLKSEGDLSVTVDGVTSVIEITADETFGSLIEKFNKIGLEATLTNGELMIQSGFKTFTINSSGTTSSLTNPNTKIGLAYNADLGGYVASVNTVIATTTTVEKRTLSVANYADYTTKMSMLNINDGTLSVFKDGQKATIQIKSDETFGQLRTRISNALSNVDLSIDSNGIVKIYATDGAKVEAGATTDSSNISAICGFINDDSGAVLSSKSLYRVNGSSKVMDSGLFRRGNVTEGDFKVGNATIYVTNTTTINDIISQINSSDATNATAYWDSVDGKLVIQSRTSGASLVNIEAGKSNFTDIMGFTSTERNADGSVKVTRLDVNSQELGGNASFTINGTRYTSTSNSVASDVTRIKGVTLNLKGISSEGGSTKLTIERDKESLANAVSDVVDAYNELIKNVDKEIAVGAALNDQSSLKMIRNQIRSLMTNSILSTNVFRNLDAIGISHDTASGGNISTDTINVLSFDKDKFLEAYAADRDALKDLLVGTDTAKGVFLQIEDDVLEKALTSSYGYFASAEKSYSSKIKRLDDKITKTQKSVEKYKERLESKFASMDLLIANMQNQYSTFLG